MNEMEIKRKKLESLFRQNVIILDYFIERHRRRGKDSSFSEDMKANLIKRYEEKDREDTKLLSRHISGYRMGLNDLKEMAGIS
jgi:hypothetical protein